MGVEIVLISMFVWAISMVLQAATSLVIILFFKKKVVWYKFELVIFILPFICYLCVAILADFDVFDFLIGTNMSGFILEQLILACLIPVIILLKVLLSLKLHYKKIYSIVFIIILCIIPVYFRTVDFIFIYD